METVVVAAHSSPSTHSTHTWSSNLHHYFKAERTMQEIPIRSFAVSVVVLRSKGLKRDVVLLRRTRSLDPGAQRVHAGPPSGSTGTASW